MASDSLTRHCQQVPSPPGASGTPDASGACGVPLLPPSAGGRPVLARPKPAVTNYPRKFMHDSVSPHYSLRVAAPSIISGLLPAPPI